MRRAASTTVLVGLVVTALAACGTLGAGPAPTATLSSGGCATGSSSSRSVAYAALPAGSFTNAAAAANGKVIRMPAGTTAFQDFTPADSTVDGGVLGSGAEGLDGAGVGKTVLEVAPGTSTHAAEIPTTFPDTNQLSVLRVNSPHAVLRDFTVQGTEQGHLFNGLRVDAVRGLRASNIEVKAIPGGASSPPGETFGVNDFRTVGSQWSHVVVDGAGVGASGFGVNNDKGIRICDVTSKNNPHGMGFAFWQSSGIDCIDCRAIDNGRAGFNFERITGVNQLVRPVVRGNTYDVRISSDLSSAVVRIVDPTLTKGHFTVTLPLAYNGVANKQRASDITLIVHGRERPDLLRIERY